TQVAGARWWPASVLPALIGTTLPLWLRPRGFSFNWLGALEFLVATVLVHAGFVLLLRRYGEKPPSGWSRDRLQSAAAVCLVIGAALGVHLGFVVPGGIFVVFGIVSLFAGLLYAAPPFRFAERPGGEIVLAVGLGLLPVLGAYLVQAGDLTRTVYLAALPMVVTTGLWVWTSEMERRVDDEKRGRENMVTMFGPAFSGRVVVPALAVLVYGTLFLAVFTASLIPLALVSVLTFGLVRTIVAVSWSDNKSPGQMEEARVNASKLHMAVGIITAASALAALGG
ncbi:MAG: hypothetical protein GF400_06670, partial [Candidatus Eisenbacteria bacterium]|nr:hypothetical protein [Candidatus Eisenbacteria bacterium]